MNHNRIADHRIEEATGKEKVIFIRLVLLAYLLTDYPRKYFNRKVKSCFPNITVVIWDGENEWNDKSITHKSDKLKCGFEF